MLLLYTIKAISCANVTVHFATGNQASKTFQKSPSGVEHSNVLRSGTFPKLYIGHLTLRRKGRVDRIFPHFKEISKFTLGPNVSSKVRHVCSYGLPESNKIPSLSFTLICFEMGYGGTMYIHKDHVLTTVFHHI